MKITVFNYQIKMVLDLLAEIYTQRMLIGDKLKVKENFEKLNKKFSTLEELRIEIIVSNGGSIEKGIAPDHENFEKTVNSVNELFQLPVEISIQTISMSALERFEISENITLESVSILAGTYIIPVNESIDKKEK